MSWTKKIEPRADAGIKVRTQNLLIVFSFEPSREVLADLLRLNERPGFTVDKHIYQKLTYVVDKPATYANADVANWIQEMLESHGLSVMNIHF